MKHRFKVELWLVALVCFLPVVAAYVLYYYGSPGELPRLANEERRLHEPAVPLPPVPGRTSQGGMVDDLWSQARWTLIYARTSPCDEACLRDLVRLYQVHASLGRDQDRVQRVYMGPGGDPSSAEERVGAAGRLDSPGGERLLKLLDSLGEPPGSGGRIYVADPHGNLVLSYPPDAGQEGLRDDLERLLDVSQIG